MYSVTLRGEKVGILEFLFGKKRSDKQRTDFKRSGNETKPEECGFCRKGKIYLDVPYTEKDRAKALGARWDPDIKKWYYEGTAKNYVKFAEWLSDSDEITIAFDYLYIVERPRICYRCGKQTRVVGLALGEHMVISEDDNGKRECSCFEDKVDSQNLFVTWELCEDAIPPALLEYLKNNYNLHVGSSKIGGVYFANHCECCGAIQGSNYLAEEDLCFAAETPEGIEELKKYRVYAVGIDEDLVIDWNIGYSEKDGVYLKYGKLCELKLPQSKFEDVITYRELHDL